MTDPIEHFRLSMVAAGLRPPKEVIADGKIHRDDSRWYVCHLDDVPAGAFGCWRVGLTSTWCAKSDNAMTDAERDAHRQLIKAMKAQRDADGLATQRHASETAAALLSQADTATVHPYLTAKGVKPHGVKAFGDRLLIPMRDTAGKLHSLQTIAPDGEKRFHPGGRIKGCYHAISKPAGLLAVAAVLHKKYSTLTIVIAADDDWRTEGNPGLTSAKQAAMAVGGVVVRPHFPTDRPPKATDFNDLAVIAGLDAVRACFLELEVFSC